MSVLSWNYRGLGQPWTIQILIETLYKKNKLESLKVKQGYESLFTVDLVGRRGRLSLFLKTSSKVSLLKFSRNCINVVVKDQNLGK